MCFHHGPFGTHFLYKLELQAGGRVDIFLANADEDRLRQLQRRVAVTPDKRASCSASAEDDETRKEIVTRPIS